MSSETEKKAIAFVFIAALWPGALPCHGSPAVATYPAGSLPSAAGPVAVSVDHIHGRIYVVHREAFRDVELNPGVVPTNELSVVDENSGTVIATVPIGASFNGEWQGVAVDPIRNLIFIPNGDDNTVSVVNGAANPPAVTSTISVSNGVTGGIALDPSAGLAYVTTNAGVTILNTASSTVTGSIPVSSGVLSIAVDSKTHLVYAAGTAMVYEIDGSNRAVKRSVSTGLLYTLHGIAVDPGSRAYAIDYNSGMVAMIDLTQTVLKMIGSSGAGYFCSAVAVDPNSHNIYTADDGASQIRVLEQSGNLLKSIPVLMTPVSIAIDATNNKAYVADSQSGSLSVTDTQLLSLSANWPLGTADFSLAVDHAAARLYVANWVSDSVSVIDTGTYAQIAQWTTGHNPTYIGVDPARQQVYTSNGDGSVWVLSTVDGSVKQKIVPAAGQPGALAVNGATHQVDIITGSSVTVLDATANAVTATISVGGGSRGIAIDEAANVVYVANDKTVTVINGSTNTVTARWTPPLPSPTNTRLWGLAVDHGLQRLYATVTGDFIGSPNGLITLDAASGAVIGQLATGNYPGSWTNLVAVNEVTHDVFFTDAGSNVVTVVSGLAPTSVRAQVPVGSISPFTWNGALAAAGLSVDETASLVYVANWGDGTFTVIPDNSASFGIPPALGISVSHAADFIQGQANAAYLVKVSNGNSAGPTIGTVTVTDNVPAGLTLISMSGTGWNCTGTTCTRSDLLNPGASYPPITVTVNVAADAPAQVVNSVIVSGGGSAAANAADPTNVSPAGNRAPSVVSLGPAVSSGPSQTYTLQISDPDGWQDLRVLNVLINNYLDGRHGCYLAYTQQSGTVFLVDDAGDAGGPYAGSLVLNGSGSIGNSQCTLSGAGSSASGSGNTLSLTLNLSFSPAFSGNKIVYVAARDSAQNNTGWQTMGVHGVPPLPASYPSAVGMAPSTGAAANSILTFTFQDASAASNLQTAWALVNTAIDGRAACYVAYYRPGNQVYLYPDNGDGSQATSMSLAGTGSISNSQCTISAQSSSATMNGGQMTVTLNVTFKPAFAGPKAVWMAVQTTGGAQTSPWQALGAWQVPGS